MYVCVYLYLYIQLSSLTWQILSKSFLSLFNMENIALSKKLLVENIYLIGGVMFSPSNDIFKGLKRVAQSTVSLGALKNPINYQSLICLLYIRELMDRLFNKVSYYLLLLHIY